MAAVVEYASDSTQQRAKAKIVNLVDRLTWQLQNGCDNAACTCPTCFTTRKRNTPQPLRKYTYLSARSIALVLVADRNVNQFVCPYVTNDQISSLDASLPSRIDPKSLVQQLCTTTAFKELGDNRKAQKKILPSSMPTIPSFNDMLESGKDFCWGDLLDDLETVVATHSEKALDLHTLQLRLPGVDTQDVVYLLQALIMKVWCGSAYVAVESTVGYALDILEKSGESCVIPWVYKSLDIEEMCFSWLTHQPTSTHRHIMSYPCIFSHIAHFEFFRTCCHLAMRRSVREANFVTSSRQRILRHHKLQVEDAYLDRRMKVASQPYLVLEIRREELLLDAFSQLWQREQRELHRPLRVRLGSDGGEIGHDLGGVQIEFFNLFCNEICDPQRGLFETDSNTHLSWFKAASLEPLHRYELLGLLFGIALFNGITLPISFPRVFYAKLMGWEVDWEDFLTDWPHLHSTFTQTAKYSGDIADLSLEHTYTLHANGVILSIDMQRYAWQPVSKGALRVVGHEASVLVQHEDQVNVEALKWPGWSIRSTTQASSPVTNENRTEYLKLYSKWVFDYSIRPQFYAFAAGFYRVVDVRAIRLLTPLSFQRLVEGSQDIDVEDLKHHTKYEACTSSTPTIKWFWSIVESYDQQKLRRLLEFVTASKRMPANGAAGLRFTIMAVEEQNGALPGSSTCFGILHLPKYETRDVMKQKLDIALEHSIGFGQA